MINKANVKRLRYIHMEEKETLKEEIKRKGEMIALLDFFEHKQERIKRKNERKREKRIEEKRSNA